MTDHIIRTFAGDLTVRADGTGRTIAGIVVPFDVEARVSDGGRPYTERFRRGSFARTIKHRGDRVKLLMQHDSAEPIGKAVELREDATGLYGEFRVSSVPTGDQALELVRDGVLDSFSVGFAPIQHEQDGDVTVRTEVALREASLVTFPAYEDARVLAVRAYVDSLPEDERAELLRMIGLATDVTATTADRRPEPAAPHDDDPASATRVATTYRRLRLRARETGAI